MIKQLIQEGFILKSKGYYKHAIEAFYKALEYDNKSSELLLEIAESYYLMRDEERALNYIEQILNSNSKHIDSLKLLKRIFIDKNAWNEATKAAQNIFIISQDIKDLAEILRLLNVQKRYREVLEYNCQLGSVDIFYEKAYASLFCNEIESAENFINMALNLDFNNSKLKLLKGKILFKQGREEDCSELVNEMNIDFKDADMLNFVGLVEQQLGNYKKSIEYFKNAISLNSNVAEYYYNCASTYFKMDEISFAKKYYNLAISIEPENPNFHLALANLYYSEKQYRRALEELDFDFYEANLLKSLILFDSGYVALAKKGFDMLKEQRPNDHLVKEYLDKIKEKMKIS